MARALWENGLSCRSGPVTMAAMRWFFGLICCGLLLSGCGRPLTENERAYLTALQGAQTDAQPIRLTNGHVAGSVTYDIKARPRRTCIERIFPPPRSGTVTVSPGATVVFNTTMFRKDLYRDDFVPDWPGRIDLLDALLFAHEMTHVWQWQNRARTGYHPLKALSEHTTGDDPYLFDPDTTRGFLDYGYEQQGAIVEEYICCALLDPDAPRTARLRSMITAEMPITGIETALAGAAVRLPWSGAQTQNICRADHSG